MAGHYDQTNARERDDEQRREPRIVGVFCNLSERAARPKERGDNPFKVKTAGAFEEIGHRRR
jgi:hypothetical protein